MTTSTYGNLANLIIHADHRQMERQDYMRDEFRPQPPGSACGNVLMEVFVFTWWHLQPRRREHLVVECSTGRTWFRRLTRTRRVAWSRPTLWPAMFGWRSRDWSHPAQEFMALRGFSCTGTSEIPMHDILFVRCGFLDGQICLEDTAGLRRLVCRGRFSIEMPGSALMFETPMPRFLTAVPAEHTAVTEEDEEDWLWMLL